MAKEKTRYVATTGIDFEGCKPSVRVEAGEFVPTLSADEIKELLDAHLIVNAESYAPRLRNTTFSINGLESEADK